MTEQTVVSREAWITARKALLEKEKAFTEARDALAAERRALPRTRVTTPYVFDTAHGERTLEGLFEGKSQLVVYHFMFAPEWEAGCKACSFWADGFDHVAPHLAARDTAFTAISRAPLEKLRAFAKRFGWTFPWASSGRTTFNYDFSVSFDRGRETEATYNYKPFTGAMTDLPGFSAFLREPDGSVLHTYSCFSRGIDAMNPAYQLLDLTARGRDEAGLPAPMAWLRHRDLYGA